MKLKQALVLSSIILGLGVTQSAYSLTFTFDPQGTAGINGVLVDTLDQSPGSAIGIGAIPAQQAFIDGGINAPGNQFTLAYQANLSVAKNGELITFSNGTGGKFFNFTAQFQEKFIGSTGVGPNTSSQFEFVNSGTNTFNIWASGVVANDLTGAGFGNATSIFSAHVVSSESSNYSNSSVINTRIDRFGNNDWGTTRSVTGSGATDLTLLIDSVDKNYFPDLSALQLVNFVLNSKFNTSQVTPFSQTNPSRRFNWVNGVGHNSNVGAINGVNGPDFLFQADGNQSITAVPEPALLLLLGTGFMGFALTRRARG